MEYVAIEQCYQRYHHLGWRPENLLREQNVQRPSGAEERRASHYSDHRAKDCLAARPSGIELAKNKSL
jgi:hypothetical protein